MPPELRTRSAQDHQNEQPCTATVAFRIPPELLTPTDRPASLLLKLPPEILMQIFSHAFPPDAILLALTCKSLLSIASLCGLRVPRPEYHRHPWALAFTPRAQSFSIPTTAGSYSCSCSQLPSILRRFPPCDRQARPSRAWGYCMDCACYRPTRKAYWLRNLGRLNTEDWSKDQGDIWQSAVRWFAAGVKLQCTNCRVAEDELNRMAEEMEELSPSF